MTTAPGDPIRVLLADDQTLVRSAFAMLVESAPDMAVVGEAGTGAEAVALAHAARADVVVMDLRMPGTDGIEATRLIAAAEDLAGVKVLVLTTYDTDDNVLDALRAGDALLSPGPTASLIARVLRAPAPATGGGAGAVAALSEREREVLTLVARGLNNTEIADALALSPLTAKTHVSRIMGKCAVRDRAQLVILAYETGLVVPGG